MVRRFIKTGIATLALAVFLPTGVRTQECEDPEECDPPPNPWEHICPVSYRNIRGFNFIPDYVSLTSYSNYLVGPNPPTAPGEAFEGLAPDYVGVASPTAMWHFYSMAPSAPQPGDTGSGEARADLDVQKQLDAVQGSGANVIRVWLSFPAWKAADEWNPPPNPPQWPPPEDYNPFIVNFKAFLAQCEARHIYVIPIIWDMVGPADPLFEQRVPDPEPVGWPDPTYVQGETVPATWLLQSWHTNPSDKLVNNFIDGTFAVPSLANPNLSPEIYPFFDTYIREVVQAGKDSPALLLWDAMNEPALIDDIPNGNFRDRVAKFLKETLRIIKEEDQVNDTLTGFQSVGPAIDEGAASFGSGWENLDVIGTQMYNLTRIRGEGAVWASATESFLSGGTNLKPIIAVETGGQGVERYSIDYAANLPRIDLGPSETGMGFVLFQAVVGMRRAEHPAKRETGLFFWDGSVRSIEDAEAFRDFSVGKSTNTLTLTFNHPAPHIAPVFPALGTEGGVFGWQGPLFFDSIGEADGYQQVLEQLDLNIFDYEDWRNDPGTFGGPLFRHFERYRITWITVQHGQNERRFVSPALTLQFTETAASFILNPGENNPFSLLNYLSAEGSIGDSISDLQKHLVLGTLNPPLTWGDQIDHLQIIQANLPPFLDLRFGAYGTIQ